MPGANKKINKSGELKALLLRHGSIEQPLPLSTPWLRDAAVLGCKISRRKQCWRCRAHPPAPAGHRSFELIPGPCRSPELALHARWQHRSKPRLDMTATARSQEKRSCCGTAVIAKGLNIFNGAPNIRLQKSQSDWVGNKEKKSSETQPQPELAPRTKFISRRVSTPGAHPGQSCEHEHTQIPSRPPGPRCGTGLHPLPGRKAAHQQLLLPAGHSAPRPTSPALNLTSGNHIKSSPPGILSPLFPLTTPHKAAGCARHAGAGGRLRKPCTSMQYNTIYFYLLAF